MEKVSVQKTCTVRNVAAPCHSLHGIARAPQLRNQLVASIVIVRYSPAVFWCSDSPFLSVIAWNSYVVRIFGKNAGGYPRPEAGVSQNYQRPAHQHQRTRLLKEPG
jgi:hypothetical protein